jgi:hypothetical protein
MTNFLVEPNPEIIYTLSTDILKVSASFCISSLLALPLSGLDFIEMVISLFWIWILPDKLNSTNTVCLNCLDYNNMRSQNSSKEQDHT